MERLSDGSCALGSCGWPAHRPGREGALGSSSDLLPLLPSHLWLLLADPGGQGAITVAHHAPWGRKQGTQWSSEGRKAHSEVEFPGWGHVHHSLPAFVPCVVSL